MVIAIDRQTVLYDAAFKLARAELFALLETYRVLRAINSDFTPQQFLVGKIIPSHHRDKVVELIYGAQLDVKPDIQPEHIYDAITGVYMRAAEELFEVAELGAIVIKGSEIDKEMSILCFRPLPD